MDSVRELLEELNRGRRGNPEINKGKKPSPRLGLHQPPLGKMSAQLLSISRKHWLAYGKERRMEVLEEQRRNEE